MRTKSKRSRKSKKVSWASGDFLHQVKLFSSEDCPAIVGLKSRDDLLQAETLSKGTERSNDVPPGFESGSSSGFEPSYVAQIPWKCPVQFVLSHTLQFASGEESEEVKQQTSRELKVLEAVYPRISSIPSSPSVSPEVEKEYYDDTQTPLVSLVPIEEEEPVDTQREITTTPSQPPRNVTVDVASVALAEAIRTSNDKGNLIDTDLLIKILSDKNMINNLMINGAPPVTEPRVVNPIAPTFGNPRPTVSFPRLPNGSSFMVPNQVAPKFNGASIAQPMNTTTVPIQPVKDMNYYKDLIRQHGEEKQETGQNRENYYHHHEIKQAHNFKPVEPKTKNAKPCMYFKSSRGCLKGANCPFQHGISVQWRGGDVMEIHSAKRMKLGGEVNRGMLV